MSFSELVKHMEEQSLLEEQTTFVMKVLGNPANLSERDLHELQTCIPEVIEIGTDDFGFTMQDIAMHLFNVRSHAEQMGIDIELPKDLIRIAKRGFNGDIDPEGAFVTNAQHFGLIAPPRKGRESP